jgi:hypothetical protein
MMGERGNRARIERRIARCAGKGTLAHRRPSVGRREIQVAAELINDNELGRIEFGLLERKNGTSPRIAFGSD